MPSLHPEWIAPDLSDSQRADEKTVLQGMKGTMRLPMGLLVGRNPLRFFTKKHPKAARLHTLKSQGSVPRNPSLQTDFDPSTIIY